MTDEAAPDVLVLVVTDDEYVREEAAYGFPPHVNVEVTDDAISAWSVLEERRPDVVLVAIRTGTSGGFALARDMSQRETLRRIPIFMLLEREQDAWLAAQAGATVAKAKPLSPGELVATTLSLLDARQPA